MDMISLCIFAFAILCIYWLCSFVYHLYLKYNPCVIACEELRAKFENRSYANNRCLHYHMNVSTLDTFHKYESADYADLWLDKYARTNPRAMNEAVDALCSNIQLKKSVMDEFDVLLARCQSSFLVYRYIQNTYTPLFDSISEQAYHLDVAYTSPAGRNHYRKDWYWNLDDIISYYAHVQTIKDDETVVREQRSESPNTKQSAPFHVKSDNRQVVSSGITTQNAQSKSAYANVCLPVIETHLSPECASYIHSHQCYTVRDYKRNWEVAGQKMVVPGCYVILDCDTNRIYVGQAQNLKKRMDQHLNGKDSDKHDNIDYAIAVLRHNILIRHIPLGKSGYYDLNEMERHLIKAYDCQYPRGYNKTKGNGYK